MYLYNIRVCVCVYCIFLLFRILMMMMTRFMFHLYVLFKTHIHTRTYTKKKNAQPTHITHELFHFMSNNAKRKLYVFAFAMPRHVRNMCVHVMWNKSQGWRSLCVTTDTHNMFFSLSLSHSLLIQSTNYYYLF